MPQRRKPQAREGNYRASFLAASEDRRNLRTPGESSLQFRRMAGDVTQAREAASGKNSRPRYTLARAASIRRSIGLDIPEYPNLQSALIPDFPLSLRLRSKTVPA